MVPEDLVFNHGLARVYGVLEQWSELVTVLDSQLEVVTTEREKIEVLNGVHSNAAGFRRWLEGRDAVTAP